MSSRKGDDKKRRERENFNKEIRAFFRNGGTLEHGISRPLDKSPQVGSKVYLDSVKQAPKTQLSIKEECCPKVAMAAFLAKVIEKIRVVEFIEFDTGIGTDEYISVSDSRDEFRFNLDGLYQIDIIVKTNGDGTLIIERDPAFEDSLSAFNSFNLDDGHIINTLLPIHKGNSIKIKLPGLVILPGTQIQFTRISDI